MSSILIIGANGFIGLKLLEKLNFFDTFYTISRSKFDIKNINTYQYQFDINKKWLFEETPDVITFCATHHKFAKLEQTPTNYVDTNISGLIKSLEYAKKTNPKCFIYFSTISIYGSPTENIIKEDSPINNPDIYGTSKLFAEKILRYYSSFFKILIIRLPGVVDTDMPENRPWISLIMNKLRNDLDVEIYNPSSYFNNIIDVDNICDFLNIFLKTPNSNKFEVVNIASSQPLKLIEVIDMLREQLNSNSKIITVHNHKKNSFIIDIKKLAKLFQFVPQTTKEILTKISLK